MRQLDLTVGVAYGTDFSRALEAIDSVLKQNPRVLRAPEPVVRVAALAASAVTLAIKPWVAVSDYGPAIGELNRGIAEAFRSRGIQIPFPQREVRLLGPSSDAASR